MKNNGYHVKEYLELLEKEKHDMFIPFDEIDSSKMGTATKTFVLCKGKYLEEMYHQIKGNKNSHYITCLNEYIQNSTLEEFFNTKVSVVLKMARYNDADYTTAEVSASKIAEILNINTPYIDYVAGDKRTIMSVDFLSYGNDLELFTEITKNGENISRIHGISLWIDSLKTAFDNKFQGITEQNKRQLILDLIRTFLIRRFVLMDNDLNSGNLGFVCNSKSKDVRLISFDYEFCFNNNSRIIDMTKFNPENFMENNLQWLAENFPDELKIVMDELSHAHEKKTLIDNVIDKHSDNPSMVQYWKYMIFKNVDNLKNCINETLNGKELIED